MPFRHPLPFVVGLALVSTGLPPAARAALAQAQQRDLIVSIVDKDDVPVPNVQPSDLVVREDGVAREVLRVRPATDPMQIALLVDNTAHAVADISNLREGLKAFLGELGDRHKVSMVTFGDRPTLMVDATTVPEVIERGVNRLFSQPNSGSYLLDAILEVTRGFKKQEAARPVIVALTTEGTEFSSAHYERVIDALSDGGVSFWVMSIGVSTTGIREDEERYRDIVIDRGTRETGGRNERVLASLALQSELKKLAAMLLIQHVVTYAHPESLIPPEKIVVTATPPGWDVRSRRKPPAAPGASK